MTTRRGSIRIVAARKQIPREIHRMPAPAIISAGDPERPWYGRRLDPDMYIWGESDIRRIGISIAENDEGSVGYPGGHSSGFGRAMMVVFLGSACLFFAAQAVRWVMQ